MLVSLRGFIKTISTQNPDLNDPTIKEIYNASIEKNKPKKKNKELLSIEEGGYSYWSYKTHRWIKGRFEKKTGKFLSSKKRFVKLLFIFPLSLSINIIMIFGPVAQLDRATAF